ncbi:thioredoxin reductase [Thalassospira mesophila]|uniref:Thioredoxin reductase n=1 Tax=Thalassospira mesophila TaxID=1293891 RepID=A0A1Y2L3K8_9PROT|nr:thioredoxin reductase [Thalassospira mesophila]
MRPAHSLPLRIMHWVNVYAVCCMVFSGWEIYNASPDLPFSFPQWATLGGWLGGALAWHLSAVWLLVLNGVAYLLYGIFSGHLKRDLRPPSPRAFLRDFVAALRLRLPHKIGHYNAVQRLFYGGVICILIVEVLTGLSIWKPVQLGGLVSLFGGYVLARNIHLAMMILIVGFIVVHLVLVAIVPRTLVAMVKAVPSDPQETPDV